MIPFAPAKAVSTLISMVMVRMVRILRKSLHTTHRLLSTQILRLLWTVRDLLQVMRRKRLHSLRRIAIIYGTKTTQGGSELVSKYKYLFKIKTKFQ
jgi:hypothetical protein